MAYINYKGENIDVGELPENATSEQKRMALFRARPGLEVEYKKYLANKQGQTQAQNDTPMSQIENAVAQDVQKINQGQQPSTAPQKRQSGPLGYEESPEELGRYEGEKNYLKSGLPELFVSLMAPELGVARGLSQLPRIGRALQQSPKAAKALQTIFGNAIPQAGVSAAFNPENPVESAGMTGAATAALDSLFKGFKPLRKAISPYLPSIFRTEKGIASELANKISPHITEQGVQNFNKAQEQGIHLLPNEAETVGKQSNVVLDALTNKLGTSEKGARNLQLYQQGKDVSSEKAVENFNQKLFNREKLGPEKKEAFKIAEQSKLPPEAEKLIFNEARIAENKDVRDAMDHLLNDSTWQEALKHIPKGDKKTTGEFLIATKERMDDKLKSLYDEGQNKKARHYKTSQDKFMEVLDDYLPKYEYGRVLHERQKARETIEDLTKKGKPHAESFKKYFDDSNNKEEFIKHIRHVEGGEKVVNELHDIFSKMQRIKPQTLARKINTKLYEESPSSATQFAAKFLSALKGGKYDKVAIDLVTSKNWPKNVKELSKAKDSNEYAEKMFKIMSRSIPKRIESEKEPDLIKPELNININPNKPITTIEEGAR